MENIKANEYHRKQKEFFDSFREEDIFFKTIKKANGDFWKCRK